MRQNKFKFGDKVKNSSGYVFAVNRIYYSSLRGEFYYYPSSGVDRNAIPEYQLELVVDPVVAEFKCKWVYNRDADAMIPYELDDKEFDGLKIFETLEFFKFKNGDIITFEISCLHISNGQANWIAGKIKGGHFDQKKYDELCKQDNLAFFKKPDGSMTGLFK